MPEETSLESLSREGLRKAMEDRLHGYQSCGPPVDPSGEDDPHVWLVEQYRQGNDRLRDWMELATEEFLENVTDPDAWPADARVNLLDTIQDCPMKLESLNRLIRQNAFEGKLDDWREAHAGLLKCTLGLAEKRSPDFWMEQFELLGDDFGALIFGGLLEHGLEFAVQRLPECCRSAVAVNAIAPLIPSLVTKYGVVAVGEAFEGQLRDLSPEAQAELREALEFEGYESGSKVDSEDHTMNEKIRDLQVEANCEQVLALGRERWIPPHLVSWIVKAKKKLVRKDVIHYAAALLALLSIIFGMCFSVWRIPSATDEGERLQEQRAIEKRQDAPNIPVDRLELGKRDGERGNGG